MHNAGSHDSFEYGERRLPEDVNSVDLELSYSDCGFHKSDARMEVRDLCKTGQLMDAVAMLQMLGERGSGKLEDYVCLLQSCVKIKALSLGKQVHSLIVKAIPNETTVIGNALVNMYCRCGSLADARSLFDRMLKRDMSTWTNMIAGYAIHGPPEYAIKLFREMEGENLQPDADILFSIVKACAKTGDLEQGKQIHTLLKKRGMHTNILVSSSLANMYAKCGSIELAHQEFKSMLVKDVVSWNTMLSGFVQHKCFDEALDLFERMVKEGVRPDMVTLSNVLTACASMQSVKNGRSVHDYILINRLDHDISVTSTLIDMYAKCGNIEDAHKLFDTMPMQSKASWNAMIAGHAQSGHAEVSLKLFWQMDAGSEKPTMVTYINAFKACAILGVAEQGKKIQERFLMSGIKANIILGNVLIDMYCKCGSMKDARQTFDRMPLWDVISWNALILGYAKHGPAEESLILFNQMESEGVEPDGVTFLSVLKACISLGVLEQAKQLHSYILQTEHETDIFVLSTLVDVYAKGGSLEDARGMFEKMQKKNVVAWNSLIAGYVQHGHLHEAFKLIQLMEETDVKPVPMTFLGILKGCVDIESLEQGRIIHFHIISRGFETNVYIGSTLVDMYGRCGAVKDAHSVFDCLPERNVVTWNALIAGYAQQDGLLAVFELLSGMGQPDGVTFLNAIQVCATSACLVKAKQMHFYIVESGFDYDLVIGNSLVDMYFKCSSLDDAQKVFSGMPKKDIVSWNSMIAGYIFLGLNQEACKLFQQMYNQGLKANEVTFFSILKVCASLGNLKLGRDVHVSIKKSGLQSDSFLGTSLIDMYSKCGRFEEAFEVFDSLPCREVSPWNAMITGCLQNGYVEEAFKIFQAIKKEDIEPDRVTFINILKACGSLGVLEQGKQIHLSAQEHGVMPDIHIENVLIDMYGKCGDMNAAGEVFDEMKERDMVSWNAMISGYAQNGHVIETLEMFHKMHAEGQIVDHIAFVSVLCVCSHAGLLDESCYYFTFLREQDIQPTHEHYACVVDTLGRASCLQEAAELVHTLPSQPNIGVWMTLLGACRSNNDWQLAKYAAGSIMEIDPEYHSTYVLLSNICVEVENLEGTYRWESFTEAC